MIFGIPSYKRPQCKTAHMLLENGIDKHDIVISVQTREDRDAYKKLHDVEIIYGEADCAAGNRNTILKYVGQPVILMDDDVYGINVYYETERKFKRNTAEALSNVKYMEDEARKIHAQVFGIAANSNVIIRGARYKTDINVLLQGTFIGIMNSALRFNTSYKVVDDYELCCRIIKQGGTTLRFNDFSCAKPKNTSNAGGCKERYENGELQKTIKRMSKEYSFFVPNKHYDGGALKLWKK